MERGIEARESVVKTRWEDKKKLGEDRVAAMKPTVAALVRKHELAEFRGTQLALSFRLRREK